MTTGNGRLWEPNQSLDGSDSLSSQKDEGTTRKILFPFWHSRMHQRLFLVIFCPFSQKWYFPSISYYFYIPKNFDYLEFHCPTEEKIGIDEKVICYHNISNLLWKKDVLSAWKKKGISKTLQILGLTASNLQTFFSIHFFSSH